MLPVARRQGVLVAILCLIALAPQAAGLTSPAIVLLIAGYAWARVLIPRWGLGAALSLVFVGWASVTFVVMSVTPLLHTDPPLTVSVVLALLGIVAAVAETRMGPKKSLPPLARGAVIASLSGAAAWILAAVLAMTVPGATGLSWAVYVDSSLDVWNIRNIAAHGGVDSTPGSNPRPAEHALSASFLPTGHPLDAASSTFATEIGAHAQHWSLLIALTGVLGGLVVAETMRGTGRLRGLTAIATGLASLSFLMAPATGVMLARGQINGHLDLVLILASYLIARRAHVFPLAALATLLLSMTLLMLIWTPFAGVPGVFACVVAWRHRAELPARQPMTLVSLGPIAVFFTWSVFSFAKGTLLGVFLRDTNANEKLVTIPTEQPVPVWLPFTGAVVLVVAALCGMLVRRSRVDAAAGGLLLLGLGLGLVPIVAARGGLGGDLEYYPARYLSISTIALLPVAIALVVRITAERSHVSRAVAAASIASIVGLAIVAPMPTWVNRWGFAPAYLLTGEMYGPSALVADRVFDFASDDEVKLAWRADPPFDYHVNFMLSVDERGNRGDFGGLLRMALRNYGPDDSIERVCQIGNATDLPVVLVTRDPTLSNEVESACPDEGVAIELLSPSH